MGTLSNENCVPVRRGDSPLSDAQVAELIPQVPNWKTCQVDGIKRLEREFKFKDFSRALDFTNRVGELAEREDHHPALLTEWGKVTVTWWTHAVNGLHRNDFIMAARLDVLYAG